MFQIVCYNHIAQLCSTHTHTHTTETNEKVDGNPQRNNMRCTRYHFQILLATCTNVSVFSVSQDSNFSNYLAEFKASEHLASLNCRGAHTLNRYIFFLEYYLNPGF